MIGGVAVEVREEEFFERIARLTGQPKGNAIYHPCENKLYVTEEVYQVIKNSDGFEDKRTLH